ncbi:hypothetical protein N665_0146s0014 [Sinapis alba]|nr:hypothetical protein N665_0146s0014 [Sinapis alba]
MGPKLDELKAALEVYPPWSFEKRKWLVLLLLQAMGLYALHHNSRIPFESAKRVFDDEAMMLYPWGRTAYEVLVDSIKMLNPQGRSYTISGMKDILLVWAYESVRVRKMVRKDSVEEMFPQWPCEAEDPQLVNLITYIHAYRFVRGFWEVEGNEKKKKVKGGVSSEAEPPTKKQKKVKKQIVSRTNEEEGSGKMVNNALLVNIMSTLENICKKFDHREGRFETIESRLNANDFKRNMPNMDQQTIDDIVKVAVAEHLKVLGIWKSSENYDNFSPQPNTQQKSFNSPMIDKTPGKGLGTKKNLADELNKATKVKKTLIEDFVSGAATPDSGGATLAKADKDAALDFFYISYARIDKDGKDAKAQKDGKDEAGQALGRGCRGKPKDHDDIVPANLRKTSKKQFAFRMRKGKYISQNTQIGDCGVNLLKFIECLAFGVTFDGINDENIQGLQVKIAT